MGRLVVHPRLQVRPESERRGRTVPRETSYLVRPVF